MGILYAKVGGSWVPVVDWANGYSTFDGRYVNVTGDDMTGRLGIAPTASGEALRLSHTNPSVQFWDTAGTPARQSLIQATSTALNITADGTRDIMFFATGVNPAAVRAATTGEVFSLGGNPDALLGFRTTGATGTTRNGFVGMSANWIRLIAEGTNGLLVQAPGGQELRAQAAGAGIITFYSGGAENARFVNNAFLLNTTDAVAANNNPGGIWSNSNWWLVANASGNTPQFVANKVGAGVVSGHDFMHFRNNNTTIGSITRNAATAAVLYNTSSDYRLKDDHGLITGALARLALLVPRRVVWKGDPTRQEQDGFFAHEVAGAVPEAVTGTKDAVSSVTDEDAGLVEGQIIAQQLDVSKLIPLLVAAVQELDAKVSAA